jgi:hypothetical protein
MANITETPIMLRLSDRARGRLATHAAISGRDISAVASDLIERAIAAPSAYKGLGPAGGPVVDSRMTDDEMDAHFQNELEAHHREKQGRSI